LTDSSRDGRNRRPALYIRHVTQAQQKVVLLAAIREVAEETGDWRNEVPLQQVGAKLWPPRDENDSELLALVNSLNEDGSLEPTPGPGYVNLAR
jgi:hypothetical protein